jgi:hypothetical protein
MNFLRNYLLRKIICGIFFLFSLAGFLKGEELRIGEKLIYKIKLLGLPAGTQTLHLTELKEINGKRVYRVFYELKSSKFLSRFYRLHDVIYVEMDQETFFPLFIEKHIQEGKYWNHIQAKIDLEQRKIKVKEKDQEFTLNLIPNTFDFISVVYYLRKRELIVGRSFQIGMFGGRKIVPNTITVIKKGRVKTPAGTFSAILVVQEPETFKIWFTDDEKRIPVKMEVKLKYGKLTATLWRQE